MLYDIKTRTIEWHEISFTNLLLGSSSLKPEMLWKIKKPFWYDELSKFLTAISGWVICVVKELYIHYIYKNYIYFCSALIE